MCIALDIQNVVLVLGDVFFLSYANFKAKLFVNSIFNNNF